MNAVMIYYLYANAPAGLGFDKADAAQLISLYATVVGMTTIIGSYVCDRILGCRRSLLVARVTGFIGYTLLAFPLGVVGYAAAMGCMVFGSLFAGRCIETLIGKFYDENDGRRDSAFTISYVISNIGAAAPALAGVIAAKCGYHAAFALSAVLSFLGTYKDVKDEEAYQENIPDYKFTETTNSAELLSMAMVYFDFDLEEAGKTAVTDYIRKLYNGSHTTSVATQTYTYWIDEDTVETYTDANVTLTTYYFNDLFSCKLKDNFGTLSGSNTAEQVWNYFISAGFTPEATAGVMGNLYQESHLDPTAIQNGGAGPAAGICQMETYQNYNSRWGQMAKLAESRGKDWTDLSSQLDFMLSDMPSQFDAYTGKSPHYYPNGEWCWWPEKMTLESYKALTDVNKATEIFERVFERGSITRMSERYESANLYYDMYKNMTPGTDVQQKIVNAAYSQLGVNYVWGGTTPNVGLDCSGLTQYCYSQAGISIPRTSQEQSEKGKVVMNPEPGDICVSNNAGHVAIYIGNGQMIEAPDVGQQVKVSAVRAEKFVRFY